MNVLSVMATVTSIVITLMGPTTARVMLDGN